MRTTPDADPERVYCKIANTLTGDGATLQQKGRCSLASNSGPIDGSISALGSNLYRGSLNSLASKGPTTVAGSATGNRLELNAEFVDAFDGEPSRSVIVIDVDTGAPYTANEIVFTN
jgi:hypothetical protein